jgi:pimeloyl-ACP methyl ester carboxylesterase
LEFPVLVLRGERAPTPTRLIAERLTGLLPASRLVVIAGAGHMGPLTHASEVSAAIAWHIEEAQPGGSRFSRGAVSFRAASEPAGSGP